MDTRRLQEAVAAEFATTGAATPSWPDPHPGGADPLEEEYSRCLDPGKYQILPARADAWVRALTELGLATTEEVEDPAAAWREGPDVARDTATRLRPVRAGTVSLLMGFRRLHGVPATIVAIGAGEPAVRLVKLPDCGCDACDSGSEDLVEEFDEYVLAVVSGEVMHVATRDSTVVATGSGWSAVSNMTPQDIEAVLTDARAGRSPHRVVRGAAWA